VTIDHDIANLVLLLFLAKNKKMASGGNMALRRMILLCI
jgi:hypothetical protein